MVGADPTPVTIETTIGGGRGNFIIVGLPDTAVREARERVKSAMRQQGFSFPGGRVVCNLSPAGIPKAGVTYDLPIALSIIAAASQGTISFDGYVAVGELSLNGRVQPVPAALGGIVVAERGKRRCLLSGETIVSDGGTDATAAIDELRDAVATVTGSRPVQLLASRPRASVRCPDLSVVRGQQRARRALEIAAAGGHHLLFSGSPGAGKSLLSRCLPGILPPLDRDSEREVALVWAAAGTPRGSGSLPPFRAPHHSSSLPAIVGGGSGIPRPGEVSKAHNGVLFLDELGEFAPSTLDALRQPLEDGVVTVARAADTVTFPADVQVVAATNPCPCGYLGDRRKPCECSDARLGQYRRRLSGPLRDRFDMSIEVPRIDARDLNGDAGESSAAVRDRVLAARERQRERGALNRRLTADQLGAIEFESRALILLQREMDGGTLTARGWDRVRRVGRTIADLDGSDVVSLDHVSEALMLRSAA